MIAALVPIFFLLLLLGLPIYASLALAVTGSMLFFGSFDPVIVPMRMFSGMNNFSLMAIPFFILAAELMRIGGLSGRLIVLAQALVGWVPGGLAAAAVLACFFFGSISGSSPATVVAIGSIMFPALVAAGYDKRFAIGLLTTAGTLGPIVPPSIGMIIYGSVTGTSIGKLFAGGVGPAVLITTVLIIYCVVHAIRRGGTRDALPTLRQVADAFKTSAWGLGLPVILMGGIYSGAFTPTESAAVACVYGWFVGAVIYKTVGYRELVAILKNAGLVSGTLLLITAGASAFSWLLAISGVPKQLAADILSMTDSPTILMMLFNLVMLVAGCFLDSASGIIVLSPLMAPIAAQVGIDPIHFGIVTVVNFTIGMLTPPVGLNLFVAVSISRMPLEQIFKACIVPLLLMLICLVLVSYIPALSLLIPTAMFG
jgi:C4-dicarboxylate transporter DctM subunit